MERRRRFLFIILLSLLLFYSIAWSDIQLPDPSKEFYVYDAANIIDSEVENYIIKTNEVLYEKTDAQVVVATIESLNDLDIKEYASLLFEKWGIGSSEFDNGVLILIAPNEKKIWIEIGYGLEGVLPDGKVGRIIDKNISPYFKEENYSEGVFQGFNSILDSIEEEYSIDLERGNISENFSHDYNEKNRTFNIFDKFKKILVAIGIIIFLFIDFRFFNGWLTYSILGSIRFGGGSNNDHDNKGGGGSSGGGGAGRGW